MKGNIFWDYTLSYTAIVSISVYGKKREIIVRVPSQFFHPSSMFLAKNLCQKELYESVIKSRTKLNNTSFTSV